MALSLDGKLEHRLRLSTDTQYSLVDRKQIPCRYEAAVAAKGTKYISYSTSGRRQHHSGNLKTVKSSMTLSLKGTKVTKE